MIGNAGKAWKVSLKKIFSSSSMKTNTKEMGAIVLSHSYRKFYKKWPEIIQRLKQNYELVTLSEIIDDKDDSIYRQNNCKK